MRGEEHTVTVEPSGIQFTAVTGQTIMAASQDAGYRWPTICGGQGDCQVCHVEVLAHPHHLTAALQAESEAVQVLQGEHGGRGPHVRLACQAGVLGDVVVLKRGVRRSRRPDSNQEVTGG